MLHCASIFEDRTMKIGSAKLIVLYALMQNILMLSVDNLLVDQLPNIEELDLHSEMMVGG